MTDQLLLSQRIPAKDDAKRRNGMLDRLRTSLLSISAREVRFERRGFAETEPQTRRHLERAGQAFVTGYNVALADLPTTDLACQLNDDLDASLVGFAFEGAAMALALLDELTPWKSKRFPEFLLGPACKHNYMVHVGAGWAAARVPWIRWRLDGYLRKFDSLLCWLVVDGFGFHQGFFSSMEYISRCRLPGRMDGYARRAFDQGLGRSMWFVHGADARRLGLSIDQYHDYRRSDLWSGVGLACAYAGGVSIPEIHRLCKFAGADRPHLAQGAAFAAKARLRANNLTPHTEDACQVICGTSAEDAAILTDRCLENLESDRGFPKYEAWRQRIREHLMSKTIGA